MSESKSVETRKRQRSGAPEKEKKRVRMADPLEKFCDGENVQPVNPKAKNGQARSTKRLVIKSFQQRFQEPNTSSFDKNWGILHDAIVSIQEKRTTKDAFEILFKAVETLCMQDYADNVYNKVIALFETFLKSSLGGLVDKITVSDRMKFLKAMQSFWNDYCQQLDMVQRIFTYLDRTYVIQNPSIQTVWDAGLASFKKLVIDNIKVSENLVPFILDTIRRERDGNLVDRDLLKTLSRMYLALKIYEDVLEPRILSDTELYYNKESQECIQQLEIGEFLRHVDKRLNDESERIDFYLDYRSLEPLQRKVDTCFIECNVELILQKGAENLLAQKKKEDLRLMYKLFGRVKSGHNSLKTAFTDYIKKIGRAMVLNPENEKTLVQDLINLKADLDKTTQECFDNNEKFVQGEKDAFDYFINQRPNKPAELVAKYMDSKLRLGNKECSEDELDHIMDKVILLFRFIQGKDVFEAFYKKALAKRLLMGRSASVDSEKAMLYKLKNECGAQFTQKLEGMFKDMEISKELSNNFGQYVSQNNPELSQIEFGVSVLTMGHWPNYPVMSVTIPMALKEQELAFEKFYTTKHNGRKLQWQHSLASAILKATFREKVKKELDVSMFQALVLLKFNEKLKVSYKEIEKATQIEESELKRTLQSLACGKMRVLLKEPKGKDIGNDDEFVFNENFNDRLYRIRISQVMMKETESEHRQTEEQVNQDRQYQIDAAIVRIMKTRKVLAHNLLLTELYNQLRFPAKPIDLKRRIESLIDREYVSRDKQDAQLYHYVA
ncbi:unnamed protein product [Bursaphelenchus xylophilus]|uniref:Cullin-4 n=1 Tax=Bursaphelenchus xylophilus TaxID=6326 RepID=A0A1I7S6H2_BURXY|nr:unnamed protein product [Bursaphelenchus xylophilus]CAG9127999.1 unnamed protein product [Bursaphelenchus xylophilus]